MAPASLPPDYHRGTTLIILVAVFGFFSTVTTLLRLSARSLTHQLGKDDLAIACAWVLLVVHIVFNAIDIHYGFGRHIFYLDTTSIEQVLKWCYLNEILLFVIICITKISICLFVLRIKNTGWLRWVLNGVMAGLVITTIPPEVVIFAQCRPLRTFWDRAAGTCWNPVIYNDVIWLQVAFSIFSDLVCTSLPVVVLWNTQIAPRLKLAICGLMGMGLIATACAAVRASLSARDFSDDLTWSLIIISDWAYLEVNLGIICANLPLSRSVYKALRGRFVTPQKTGYEYQISSARKKPSASASRLRKYRFVSTLMSSTNKSQESVIPLESRGITKTMDLAVMNEPSSVSPSERNAGGPYDMCKILAEDRV